MIPEHRWMSELSEAESLLTTGRYEAAAQISSQILRSVSSLPHGDGTKASVGARAACVLLQSLFETDRFSSAAPTLCSVFGAVDDAPPTALLLWISLALDDPASRSAAQTAVLRLLRTKAPKHSGWTRRHYLTLLTLYVMECVLPAVRDVSQVRLWLHRQKYLALDPRELAFLDCELQAADATNFDATMHQHHDSRDATNTASIHNAGTLAKKDRLLVKGTDSAGGGSLETDDDITGRRRSSACLAALDAAACGDLSGVLGEEETPGASPWTMNQSNAGNRRQDDDIGELYGSHSMGGAGMAAPSNFALSARQGSGSIIVQSPPMSPLPTYVSEASGLGQYEDTNTGRSHRHSNDSTTYVGGHVGPNRMSFESERGDTRGGALSAQPRHRHRDRQRTSFPAEKERNGEHKDGADEARSEIDHDAEVYELDWLGRVQQSAFAVVGGACGVAVALFRAPLAFGRSEDSEFKPAGGGGGSGGGARHSNTQAANQTESVAGPSGVQTTEEEIGDNDENSMHRDGRRLVTKRLFSTSTDDAPQTTVREEASSGHAARVGVHGATQSEASGGNGSGGAFVATIGAGLAMATAAWMERAWLTTKLQDVASGIVVGAKELAWMGLKANPNPLSRQSARQF